MKRLAPSERVMVCYALMKLLGETRLRGQVSIYVNQKLTIRFTAAEIWAVIEKLEVLNDVRTTTLD